MSDKQLQYFKCPHCGVELGSESSEFFFVGRLLHQSKICRWTDVGLHASGYAQVQAYLWADEFICEYVVEKVDKKKLKAFMLQKRIENGEV